MFICYTLYFKERGMIKTKQIHYLANLVLSKLFTHPEETISN